MRHYVRIISVIYYTLKPLMPRSLQIIVRRVRADYIKYRCKNTWPVDVQCGKQPDGWAGWPEKKQFALILTHDIESALGVRKSYELAQLDKSYGFRSSFNFVGGDYQVPNDLRSYLLQNGFEIGVHGFNHKVNMFKSRKIFAEQARRINQCLQEWESVGFRSPCMYHNLDWIHELDIDYDASTFDIDPFEPQSDGIRTIFPLVIRDKINNRVKYIELPYTLPQDHLLFIVLREKNIDIWKRKLDWIAKKGGMALLITHPDYMKFHAIGKNHIETYSADFYSELLEYMKRTYADNYWHVLPRTMAKFWRNVSEHLSSKE